MANFLTGYDEERPATDGLSVWSVAREASKHLDITWNISDSSPSLCVGEDIVTNRRQIFKSIRAFLRTNQTADLKSKKRQGRTLSCLVTDKVSSHFHRTGDYLRFTDWKWIHSSRLRTVGLNGYKPRKEGVYHSCRHCDYNNETLPHVINHCKPLLQRGTDRHNKIVKRVKTASSRHWNYENQNVCGTLLRPDLVLEKNGHVIILDVACPFNDGIECFNETRQKKIQKHQPLIEILCRRYKSVFVDAVIVGSLGSWDPKNDRTLKRLCTKKYLKLMKKLIVSETIRASRDIYYEHIWGFKQYDYRSRQYRGQRRPNQNNTSTLPHTSEPMLSIAPLNAFEEVTNLVSDSRNHSENRKHLLITRTDNTHS